MAVCRLQVRHSLYEPLELLFSEELFTKLAGIISSTLPAYRIADDVFLVELFEGALVGSKALAFYFWLVAHNRLTCRRSVMKRWNT